MTLRSSPRPRTASRGLEQTWILCCRPDLAQLVAGDVSKPWLLCAGLEQLEKHSVLRARNKELQESVQSLHAVLASTEAELGGRNEEVRLR